MTKQEGFQELLNTLDSMVDIDIHYFFMGELENIEDFDDMTDILDNKGALNKEIIYYASAIKYLKDNDPSLKESLELAEELGYTTSNLNSELLASLLAKEYLKNNWEECRYMVDEFFDENWDEELEIETQFGTYYIEESEYGVSVSNGNEVIGQMRENMPYTDDEDEMDGFVTKLEEWILENEK